MMRSLISLIFLGGLSACGGSSGSGQVLESSPVIPTPNDITLEPTAENPAAPTSDEEPPVPDVPITSISIGTINTAAEMFIDLLNDIDANVDDTELAPTDTVADLQARGDATYEGALFVFNDAARVDGFVGNSVIAVGFDDPNTPTVTGAANGFIYVDGPELGSAVEIAGFLAIPDDTPTYAATGDIAFSAGELANTEGVAVATLNIAGTLTAQIGTSNESVTLDGGIAVLFDDGQAFGVGGNDNDPDFDLTDPEVFFFGSSAD